MFSPRRSPRRPLPFSGLRYKADFLFRSFIFSWERFWRPRKKRLPSPGSRSILHLLESPRGSPGHPLPPQTEAAKLRALLLGSLSLASASSRPGQARRQPGKGECFAKSLRWWSLRGVLQVWSAPLNFATRLPALFLRLFLHLGLLPPLVLGLCAGVRRLLEGTGAHLFGARWRRCQ